MSDLRILGSFLLYTLVFLGISGCNPNPQQQAWIDRFQRELALNGLECACVDRCRAINNPDGVGTSCTTRTPMPKTTVTDPGTGGQVQIDVGCYCSCAIGPNVCQWDQDVLLDNVPEEVSVGL